MIYTEYSSPCGRLLLGVQGGRVILCDWMAGDRTAVTLRRIKGYLKPAEMPDDASLLEKAALQLDEYFEGMRREFDLTLAVYGTEFQRDVWAALTAVPYGETASYRDVALTVARPAAVRAVAAAIAANPLSILVPCHRIIGSDGALTGYAGGLEAKKYLLLLESGKRP